jgi:hypothetical protein
MQLLWNMFRITGKINDYMFYKALENSSRDNRDFMHALGGLGHNDVQAPQTMNHGGTKYTF